MKVVGSAQITTSESLALEISPYLATALGARNGATLYAVGFRHKVPVLRCDADVDHDLLNAWREFLHVQLGPIATSQERQFDASDEENTRSFQTKQALDVDGVVGPQTLGRAIKLGLRWAFATPQVSILASPFPTASWSKLFRVRVLRSPRSGSAHELLHAVRVLGLACRFMELVEPIDLKGVELFSRRHLPRYGTMQVRSSLVAMTPVDLVLELPAADFSFVAQSTTTKHRTFGVGSTEGTTGSIEGLGGMVDDLHKKLREFLQDSSKDPPIRTLQDSLLTVLERIYRTQKDDLNVVELARMLTLNAIAASEDTLGSAREKLKIERRRDGNRSTLVLDVNPWRPLLWHQEQQMPLVTRTDENNLLAISYADSEERVICWHFYEVRQRVIAELDIRVPSDVSDFLWREWVYEVLKHANGVVVASYTSPRLKDGVTACRAVVVFPFREDAPRGGFGDVSLILSCFDELLGSRGRARSRRYEHWCAHLGNGGYHDAAKHALGAGPDPNRQRWRGLLEGTAYHMEVELETAKMWSAQVDPGVCVRGQPELRYINRFKTNPFKFTRSLNLQEYVDLYSNEPDGSTRLDLANRIIDIIRGGENVSLVGAHRCGKSTVLNLVHDTLDGSQRDDARSGSSAGSPLIVPIRLDAAVTPIGELPAEIIRFLDRRSSPSANDARVSPSGKVVDAFKSVANANVRLKLGVPGLEALGVKAEVEIGDPAPPAKQLLTPAQAVRTALQLLRAMLEKLEASGLPVMFLVMIDELSDGLVWGDEKTSSAAWRTMIEQPEFRRIRWLVASSRPMRLEMSYSPFSNVFREETVGCLSLAEANRCIDAFSDPTSRPDPSIPSARDESSRTDQSTRARIDAQTEELAPVVTPLGRSALLRWTGRLPFLLQVACSYVFTRATQREVPIITAELVQETLEERVAMELSDYFEAQWAELRRDPTIQQEILDSLRRRYGEDASAVWQEALVGRPIRRSAGNLRTRALDSSSTDPKRRGDLGPASRRALSRSGLEGTDGHVTPLAAFWLLSTVNPKRDDANRTRPTRRSSGLHDEEADRRQVRDSMPSSSPPPRSSSVPGRPAE